MNKLSCDQIAWLLDIAERYIPYDTVPEISRQREMKCYAMLYEIMEITGSDFEDDKAAFNATPNFVNQWEQRVMKSPDVPVNDDEN